MELFSELYGCYYTVLAHILARAKQDGGATLADIETIIAKSGFQDTAFHLLPKLVSGEWPLLSTRDGRFHSVLACAETGRPTTALERAWLKALLKDPRMRLFLDDAQIAAIDSALWEAPLFAPDDFYIYDAAKDGDDYADPAYRARFGMLLNAIKRRIPLLIEYEGGKRRVTCGTYAPWRLVYSAKDDKFRLLAMALAKARSKRAILNVSRMLRVEVAGGIPFPDFPSMVRMLEKFSRQPSVLLRIYPERNALERAMLQFAAFRKETEYDEESGSYLCRIYFDASEETELLIRVLSFGPMVKALEPAGFVAQVRERIGRQLEIYENG